MPGGADPVCFLACQAQQMGMSCVCPGQSKPLHGGEYGDRFGEMPRCLLSLPHPFSSSVFPRNKMLLLDGFELCPFLQCLLRGSLWFSRFWCSRLHVRVWKGMDFPKAKSPFPGYAEAPRCPWDFVLILPSLGKASLRSPVWLWLLLRTWKECIPKMDIQSYFLLFFSKNTNNLRTKPVSLLPEDCPSLSLSSLRLICVVGQSEPWFIRRPYVYLC